MNEELEHHFGSVCEAAAALEELKTDAPIERIDRVLSMSRPFIMRLPDAAKIAPVLRPGEWSDGVREKKALIANRLAVALRQHSFAELSQIQKAIVAVLQQSFGGRLWQTPSGCARFYIDPVRLGLALNGGWRGYTPLPVDYERKLRRKYHEAYYDLNQMKAVAKNDKTKREIDRIVYLATGHAVPHTEAELLVGHAKGEAKKKSDFDNARYVGAKGAKKWRTRLKQEFFTDFSDECL